MAKKTEKQATKAIITIEQDGEHGIKMTTEFIPFQNMKAPPNVVTHAVHCIIQGLHAIMGGDADVKSIKRGGN